MNLKYKLIEEVLKTVSSDHTGTPRHRRNRQTTLISMINHLIHLDICPPLLTSLSNEGLTKLIAYWQDQGKAISTIRNKIAILKWYFVKQGVEPNFLPLRNSDLARPRNKIKAYIDASIADQVFNPLIKTILDFQFQFGLSQTESVRLDLWSAIKDGDLFISRKISHNSKSRYVSIMSKTQRQAVNYRQKLTHTRPTLIEIMPEKMLMQLYRAELYQAGIKKRVDMRHFYARNKLADLQRKMVDKDKAYALVMADMGFSNKAKLMEFLS